jgi:hypothetical protein
MTLPSVFLIHSATLSHKVRQFTLGYDGGSAVFTAGKTLTGATSHATATIISTGVAASGTLTVHTITGTFQDNEVLSDNGTPTPGAAVTNGVIADSVDSYGELSWLSVTSTPACRFISPREIFRGMTIATTPRVLLPAGTTVTEGDTLTSTETGYSETYRINSVTVVYEAAIKTVSHITCEIAAVV